MTLLLGGLWNSFMMIPFTYSMIMYFGGLYALAYNGCHNKRLLVTSFLLALLLSLPFFYSENTIPFADWFILLPFLFYIAHSFHATLHEKSSYNIHYIDLFYTVWNTGIILGIAALFALLVNGLILLLVGMLKIAGIETSFLLNNAYYLVFRYLGLLIIGIGIIKQQVSIVYKTRLLAFQLAWFIYPLIIVFSLIALILYGVNYHNTDNTNALRPFLVTFFVLGLLFFNAVFQEGKRLPQYPYWLSHLVKIYPIFLGCLAIILFCHAMEYVFSVRNVWLIATLILLYGISYAISVFLKEDKAVSLIKSINVVLAIYFVIVALIANSPVYTFIKPPANNLESVLSNSAFSQTFDHWQVSNEKKAELMRLFGQHKTLLNKNGLTWKPFYPDRNLLPDNAEICQVPYKDGFEPGSIIERKCVITYGGKILPVEQFLYLDKTDTVSWQSWPAKQPIPLGIEFIPDQMSSTNPEAYLRVLYVCKVTLNKHDHIGKIVGNYCNIAYQGEEKPVPNFQVLGFGEK